MDREERPSRDQWPDFEKNPNAEEFRKLFVGGLDAKTTVETLREYFSSYGTIENCDIMKERNNPQKSKGFGFITFDNPNCLDEIQKNRPHEIDGKKIETKRATPKSQQYWATKKLYIKDFPKELEEEELIAEMREVFGKYGTVKDIKLVKEKDNALKGFGFIEFEDEDAVDKCNLYRKFMIKGATARVAKAFSQDKNMYYPRGQGYNPGFYDYMPGGYGFDYYNYPPYNYGRGDGYGRRYQYNDYNFRGGRGFNRGGGGRPYNQRY